MTVEAGAVALLVAAPSPCGPSTARHPSTRAKQAKVFAWVAGARPYPDPGGAAPVHGERMAWERCSL